MKFPLAADAFSPVQFSQQEQDVLHSVTKAIVNDSLLQYHAQRQFHAMAMATASSAAKSTLRQQQQTQQSPHIGVRDEVSDAGQSRSPSHYSVDAQRWRLLKHRDSIRVYKERSSFLQSRVERQEQQSSHQNRTRTVSIELSDLDHHHHQQQQAVLPMMMAIGSVQGSVDDTVYGLLSHTQEMAKARASYVGDDVVDSQVLASLTRPCDSEPLQSLSVKWCAKRHNGIIRSLVRYRDFVFIEATGVARDQNGERIGYHVIHSIAVPSVRELHEMNVVRAKISMCCLFRQTDSATVELFMNGFLNPLGDVRLSAAMASAAESVLSIWRTIQWAQMKKLAWELTTAATATSQRRATQNVDSCEICWKLLRANLHSSKQCQMCQRYLCSRCRVSKKLYLLSPMSSRIIHKSVLFCSCCVFKSTQTSSLELAVRESTPHASDGARTATATLSPASVSSIPSHAPQTPKSFRSCASSATSSICYFPMPSSENASVVPTPSSRRGSRISRWFH